MIKKAVVVLPVDEQQKKILQETVSCPMEFIPASLTYFGEDPVTRADLEGADVVIGNVSPQLLQGLTELKFVQLFSAGTDGYTSPGVLPEGCLLANATGAYGLAISEHMLGMLLCVMKRLQLYRDQQKSASWDDLGPVSSIYGSTCLVIGMGDIGGEFAKRMKALGSYVIGVRRRSGEKPDYCDEMGTTEQLVQYLPRADVIAMALPGTKQTYHIMDSRMFSYVKKGTWLINVGRGNAIDQDALLQALDDGTIAGCGLDVTQPEPLPADHPLWQMDNVLITPHVSGGFHLKETHDRIVRIAAENLKAYDEGRPICNEVDFETGYRK